MKNRKQSPLTKEEFQKEIKASREKAHKETQLVRNDLKAVEERLSQNIGNLTDKVLHVETGVATLANRVINMETGVATLANRVINMETGVATLANRVINLEAGAKEIKETMLTKDVEQRIMNRFDSIAEWIVTSKDKELVQDHRLKELEETTANHETSISLLRTFIQK